MNHFENLECLYALRGTQTRSEAAVREEDCVCCVCERARLYGGAWMKFLSENKKARTVNKENSQPGPLRLCPDCFQPIYQGCRHACGSEAEVANISRLLGAERMDKLCHSYIQEKASIFGDNLVSVKGIYGPMKLAVNPKPKKPKKMFGLKQTLALRTEGNFTSKYDFFLISFCSLFF